jgi:drug/metabolite transporter (DMT)-like permease
VHLTATRVLSAALVVIGVAMVARTIAGGGGPIASGVVLGVLFCALGAGRLVMTRHG